MNRKEFYEDFKSFSGRTISEYYISPGIKCKFDLLKRYIGKTVNFTNAIDLGCSGNSFLFFFNNILHNSLVDIASFPLLRSFWYNEKSNIFYKKKHFFHPICSDLSRLPYREKKFDFISALDVLEHVKDDSSAISEISRILKDDGLLIITVPHGMKFYTRQDELIGHFRRYEIKHLNSLLNKNELKIQKIFGIYGALMKIAKIQAANPARIDAGLIKLRYFYESNILFSKIWDVIVKVGAKLMEIDVKHHLLEKVLNIGFIITKK